MVCETACYTYSACVCVCIYVCVYVCIYVYMYYVCVYTGCSRRNEQKKNMMLQSATVVHTMCIQAHYCMKSTQVSAGNKPIFRPDIKKNDRKVTLIWKRPLSYTNVIHFQWNWCVTVPRRVFLLLINTKILILKCKHKIWRINQVWVPCFLLIFKNDVVTVSTLNLVSSKTSLRAKLELLHTVFLYIRILRNWDC
jgi:heme/copper-type cytochrome/quinol oxidase subunit 2